METLPLIFAAGALAIDLFVLVRPKVASNPQFPDWPWRGVGFVVFIATLFIVGFSEPYYLKNREWLAFIASFVLIVLSIYLMIFTFTGWGWAKRKGDEFARSLNKIAKLDHGFHRLAVLIAAVGILFDIALRTHFLGL